jgi:hypothetical protein
MVNPRNTIHVHHSTDGSPVAAGGVYQHHIRPGWVDDTGAWRPVSHHSQAPEETPFTHEPTDTHTTSSPSLVCPPLDGGGVTVWLCSHELRPSPYRARGSSRETKRYVCALLNQAPVSPSRFCL